MADGFANATRTKHVEFRGHFVPLLPLNYYICGRNWHLNVLNKITNEIKLCSSYRRFKCLNSYPKLLWNKSSLLLEIMDNGFASGIYIR